MSERGVFDNLAARVSGVVSRAPFFAFCVLLVVLWAPSYFLFKTVDTWQLIINTVTTIVTFLLVALTQNQQARTERANDHKTDALADALADLIDSLADTAVDDTTGTKLRQHARDLREAVGIQERTGA